MSDRRVGQGDGVAECLQLAGELVGAAVPVDAAGVEVGAEVCELSGLQPHQDNTGSPDDRPIFPHPRRGRQGAAQLINNAPVRVVVDHGKAR